MLVPCLLFVLLIALIQFAGAQQNPGCELGWYSNFEQCFFIGPPLTWDDARRFCHQNRAELINMFNVQSQYSVLEPLLDRGITEFWGEGTVKDGRLVKQDLKGYLYSIINFKELEINGDDGCTIYNYTISKSSFETEDDGSGQNNYQSKAQIANCSQARPFVCYKFPESPIFTQVSICPLGWVGNYNQSNCYKLFSKNVTGQTAELACSGVEGELARATTTNELRRVSQIVSNFASGTKAIEVDMRPNRFDMVWVRPVEEGVCSAFSTTLSQPLFLQCDYRLPYLCSTPVNFKVIPTSVPILFFIDRISNQIFGRGVEYLAVNNSTLQKGTLELQCSVDVLAQEFKNLNWVKDGAFLLSSRENILNIDYSFLSRRDTSEFREWNDLLGYYWCEIVDIETSEIKRSKKMYIDLEGRSTFAVSASLKNKINEESAYTFNMMRQNNIKSEFIDQISKNLSVKINRFRSRGRIVDFQVFVENNAKDVNNSRLFEQLKANVTNAGGTLISFKSTVKCSSTRIKSNYSGTERIYSIPETSLGGFWKSRELCPVDDTAMAMMSCTGDRIFGVNWGPVTVNKNCNFQEDEESQITETLSNILNDMTSTNVDESLTKVLSLTTGVDELSPVDIIYTSSILNRVSILTNKVKPKSARNFVNIFNTVQGSDGNILQDANLKGNVSNRLISSLEDLESIIATDDDDDDDDDENETNSNNVRIVTEKTVVDVWDIGKLKDPVIGLSVNTRTKEPVNTFDNDSISTLFAEQELIYKTTSIGIFLNKTFVRNIMKEKRATDSRISLHVLTNSNLFLSGNTNRTVNSKIISATMTVGSRRITDMNGSLVTTVFFPNRILQDQQRSEYSICAFWDFTLRNYTGDWSTRGCRYSRTVNNRDVCTCDHLTNFAILLDYYGQDNLVSAVHQEALSIITIIGLCLSIVGLSLTVISFILFRKLRDGLPQITLFNLALAMLCSWIVFMAGINRTDDHIGCLVVAALLHYFIMASFMWMLMEAILQYLLFVKIFGTYYQRYMLKTSIIAWGLPLLPVCIMLGIDVELYNGGKHYCWMGLTGFYYGFAIPVGVVMFLNITVFVLVTYSLCTRKSVNSKNQSMSNVRAAACSFIILGLSWVFGFLAISEARLVFQYIFTIVNSLQGFLIFLLFTLRDKKVRDYWKALCCKKSTTNESSSNNTNYK